VTAKRNIKPTTVEGLRVIIRKEMDRQGVRVDLNQVDVSGMTSMTNLFDTDDLRHFNGDISRWDVSHVREMCGTFEGSDFNGDVSRWDVSNVQRMDRMFAKSKFNKDLSAWDVKTCTIYRGMFVDAAFNSPIFKIKNTKRWVVQEATESVDTSFRWAQKDPRRANAINSMIRSVFWASFAAMFVRSAFRGSLTHWSFLDDEIMARMFRDTLVPYKKARDFVEATREAEKMKKMLVEVLKGGGARCKGAREVKSL
jgi:Mycoplasma protein of unknown function, DUF285